MALPCPGAEGDADHFGSRLPDASFLHMHLPGLIYRGAPLDDLETLEQLPPDLQQLLAIRNGFVAFRGAVHVRGACVAPAWHSLRAAWEGPAALHHRLEGMVASDVPFAQDGLGRQFILREGSIIRLDAASSQLQPLDLDVTGFMLALYERPAELLPLEAPLAQLISFTGAPAGTTENA